MDQITIQIEIQEDNEGLWWYKLYKHTATYLENIKYPVIAKINLTDNKGFNSYQEAFDAAHRWMSVTDLAYPNYEV